MQTKSFFCACFISIVTGSVALAQTEHKLTISAHKDVAFTNAQADAALSSASTILETDEDGAPGTTDTSCNVKLSRSGSISKFTSLGAPKNIDSESKLQAILQEPSNVKIVESIGWCEQKPSLFLGCAANGKRNFLVTNSSVLAGHIWAHEFGHTVGLQHRGTVNELMYGNPLTANSKRVVESECNRFVAGAPAIVVAASAHDTKTEPSKPPSPGSMSELVNSVVVHKLPFAYISAHNRHDLELITPMLRISAQSEKWPMVATIMGVLGGPEHARILMDFIEWKGGNVDVSARMRGRQAALFALGYILNRTGDAETLAFLLTASQSRFWTRMSRTLGANAEARDSRTDSLRTIAVTALALSGRNEVNAMLQNTNGLLASRMSSDQKTSLGVSLMKTYSEVREKGLARYYEEEVK